MARRIVHQLVDDIDGTVLEVGAGESIRFSLENISYEIDLSTENAAALRSALEPYIAAARRSSNAPASRGGARKRAAGSPETAVIREWASSQGLAISERGRIPASIIEAYRAAH
ncbi:histone-like nucleoid-structuring protein Lsr2 [Microbacterium sp. GXF6406]